MAAARRLAVLAAALVLATGSGAAGWVGAGRAGAADGRHPQPAPDLRIPPASTQASAAQAALPQLRSALADLAVNDRFMGVVLVARGDDILLREAYGLADRESGAASTPEGRFRLASVSKQFTAAAILRLQDKGRLSVDDPICRWITPCPQGWDTIRLSHLMSHTSGLPDQMARPGWDQQRYAPATLAQLTSQTTAYAPTFEPGSKVEYDNAAFNLLSEVVLRADGRPLETFLQDEFFAPLGMTDTGSDVGANGRDIVTGYNEREGGGFERRDNANVSVIPGAGALFSTVDDQLKWQRALHHDRVLSARSYAQMIADHAPQGLENVPGYRPRDWGFGLFVSDLGSGVEPAFTARQIYHTGSWGGFRNLVTFEPEHDVVVVILTNNYHQADRVWLIAQQAVAEATGRPFPTALKS